MLKAPSGGTFGQCDPQRRALVCGLVAQGRNQVIGASKWWELQDCQSLAESWSTWILGCSPKKEGTAALPGVVPDIPEPTLPDSGLGAPQEKGTTTSGSVIHLKLKMEKRGSCKTVSHPLPPPTPTLGRSQILDQIRGQEETGCWKQGWRSPWVLSHWAGWVVNASCPAGSSSRPPRL